MSDNYELEPGLVIATDNISDVHHQRTKVQHGENSTAIDVSDANPLPVSDYGLQVSRGLVPGVRRENVIGMNPDIDTGDGFEVIWDGSTDYLGQAPVAAETLEFFSSDVNDTSAGSGAQSVSIRGLDGDFAEIGEILPLNGTTPVVTANSYLRFRFSSVASGNNNVGTITYRQSITTDNVFAVMQPGYGNTQVAAFTVPAGKSAFVTAEVHSLSKKDSGVMDIQVAGKFFGVDAERVLYEFSLHADGTSAMARERKYPFGPIPEKTDMFVRGSSSVNNLAMSSDIAILLIDN